MLHRFPNLFAVPGTAVPHAMLLVLLTVLCRPVAAQIFGEPPPRQGNTWALLIGVEEYEHVNSLPYVGNDVVRLRESLIHCLGFDRRNVKAVVNGARAELLPGEPPTCETIRRVADEFLRRPLTGDTLIVYFSGHGVQDESGKLYLAACDFKPDQPDAAGVSAEWLKRQLAESRAHTKLLIVDSCFAGTEKSVGTSAAARLLSKDVRDGSDVVVLCSSRDSERSFVFPHRQQSLFSYWLDQGFRGHADLDFDGRLTLDELYKYTESAVRRTSQQLLGRVQTPVRVVRTGVHGDPVIASYRPMPLPELLCSMEEQLAWTAEVEQLESVGTLEFIVERNGRARLGWDFGLLGSYCEAELYRRLLHRKRSFRMLPREEGVRRLQQKRITVEQMAGTEVIALTADDAEEPGPPALVRGRILGRTNQTIQLRAELISPDGQTILASTGGTASITESEWAMLGRSAHVGPQDREIVFNESGEVEDALIARLDEQVAAARHPLQREDFPFRLSVLVNGEERFPSIHQGRAFVCLSPGESYRIRVHSLLADRGDRFLKLLVDGRNTAPEQRVGGGQQFDWGVRVNLADARPWVLEKQPNPEAVWVFEGFLERPGLQTFAREFQVVEPMQALAQRTDFSEQLGIITAAFYFPAATVRRATEGGQRIRTTAPLYRGDQRAGALMSVVHLYYLDAKAFARIGHVTASLGD